MSARVYAYVPRQCCPGLVSCLPATCYLPGERIGEERVAKHGDYTAWVAGRRETARILRMATEAGAAGSYEAACARAVMIVRGWFPGYADGAQEVRP